MPPQSGTQYGFKYYYKIGRVTVERIDSTESSLGDEEVYKYYVWLDREGGNISATTEPKRAKGNPYLYVTDETLCAFRFDFGSRDISKIRVEIETGGQAYTMFSISQTPAMFKPGIYDIRIYYDGSLEKAYRDIAWSEEVKTLLCRYCRARQNKRRLCYFEAAKPICSPVIIKLIF